MSVKLDKTVTTQRKNLYLYLAKIYQNTLEIGFAFGFSCVEEGKRLPVLWDPEAVFGQDTSFVCLRNDL